MLLSWSCWLSDGVGLGLKDFVEQDWLRQGQTTTNLCLKSLVEDSISSLRSSDEKLGPKGNCIILLQASRCFILVRIKLFPEVAEWFDDLHSNYRCGLEAGARGKELGPCGLYPRVLY